MHMTKFKFMSNQVCDANSFTCVESRSFQIANGRLLLSRAIMPHLGVYFGSCPAPPRLEYSHQSIQNIGVGSTSGLYPYIVVVPMPFNAVSHSDSVVIASVPAGHEGSIVLHPGGSWHTECFLYVSELTTNSPKLTSYVPQLALLPSWIGVFHCPATDSNRLPGAPVGAGVLGLLAPWVAIQ